MPVYYDISDIVDYARYDTTVSGIQRVSLALLARLADRHGSGDLRVLVADPRSGRLAWYEAGYFAAHREFDRDSFVHHFSVWCPPLQRASDWLRQTARFGRMPHTPVERACARPVELREGDVIFVPGATWGLPAQRKALAAARLIPGVTIYQFIHDLVPLTVPEHVLKEQTQSFTSWFDEVSRLAHGFIANSHATRTDLEAWLAARNRPVPTRVVPLAHQLGSSPRPRQTDTAPGMDSLTGERLRKAARDPFVLCVGTREPRKNLVSLARAWQLMHDALGDATPRLVLAGKHGWLNHELDALLASSGVLRSCVEIFDRPTDAELAALYRSCLFSIYVSYKEGWGLPIGEGLWFGRPVICSGVSSMPEVGGVLADYVDPASVESIVRAAMRMVADADYREARARQIAAADLRSWDDVACDLWAALVRTPVPAVA